MKREWLKDYLKENILILDGATGTELQKRGMPKGVCPEKWVIDNPETIIDLQKKYIDAGSNVVYTCSFGGNRIKLEGFGLGDKVTEMNCRLAQISKEAVGDRGFVAGDLAPTGNFIEPFGDMSFETAVDIYKEQVSGLLAGGVDLFVIETMMDIQEARAALIAVKESCDLPVLVSMTFDESGKTLTGTDPVTALITLQSLGADVVGCNCSTGPADMIRIISAMKPYAKVPLMAKPNAGLPKLIDGETVFDMGPVDFGLYASSFASVGINIIGGCCGTSPEYIEQVKKNIIGITPKQPVLKSVSAITSTRKTVLLGADKKFRVIGERINPTGKKMLQEDLREGETYEVQKLASDQIKMGADILDINVGLPGTDEKELMKLVVEFVSSRFNVPLCIDSSSSQAIEAALRIYPGRALINSITAEESKLQELLPVAAKYGAMFIILPIDDAGIPDSAEERCEIVEKVFNIAKEYGYEKSDIIVDGLVMTVSVNQNSVRETLKVIKWCSEHFGCASVVGLSNVSFGLPERLWINAAFLAMAIAEGLSTAILNPSSDIIMNTKMASEVLSGRDLNGNRYISRFKGTMPQDENKQSNSLPAKEKIYNAVIKGEGEEIINYITEAIEEGANASEIVDEYLIPAITQVGCLYEKKEYYLPQLIRSAETMKKAFAVIEPILKTNSDRDKKSVVILAAVKGDVHDIGKNIVGLMLGNFGFTVYDLGKDVRAEEIIKAAKEKNASIIGLSALMTTTMIEMKKVIKLVKEEGLKCKVMIGGAAVNEKFAIEIGADGYAEDAHKAVSVAQELLK